LIISVRGSTISLPVASSSTSNSFFMIWLTSPVTTSPTRSEYLRNTSSFSSSMIRETSVWRAAMMARRPKSSMKVARSIHRRCVEAFINLMGFGLTHLRALVGHLTVGHNCPHAPDFQVTRGGIDDHVEVFIGTVFFLMRVRNTSSRRAPWWGGLYFCRF
jgi:hypothetical protein